MSGHYSTRYSRAIVDVFTRCESWFVAQLTPYEDRSPWSSRVMPCDLPALHPDIPDSQTSRRPDSKTPSNRTSHGATLHPCTTRTRGTSWKLPQPGISVMWSTWKPGRHAACNCPIRFLPVLAFPSVLVHWRRGRAYHRAELSCLRYIEGSGECWVGTWENARAVLSSCRSSRQRRYVFYSRDGASKRAESNLASPTIVTNT